MNKLLLGWQRMALGRSVPAVLGFLMAVYMTHFGTDMSHLLRDAWRAKEPLGILGSILILTVIGLVSFGISRLNRWALWLSFLFAYLLVGFASIIAGMDKLGMPHTFEVVFFTSFGFLWVLYWGA